MVTEHRTDSASKMLSIWHVHPWVNESADLLVGTAWGETEVARFQNEISRIQPKCSVLLTPLGVYDFQDIPSKWSSHFWVDGARAGDLIG